MERVYSEPDRNYSNPNSPNEFLARHYSDEHVSEYVAVPPVDLSERQSEGRLEKGLSGDELDFLQDSLGLD